MTLNFAQLRKQRFNSIPPTKITKTIQHTRCLPSEKAKKPSQNRKHRQVKSPAPQPFGMLPYRHHHRRRLERPLALGKASSCEEAPARVARGAELQRRRQRLHARKCEAAVAVGQSGSCRRGSSIASVWLCECFVLGVLG